MLFTHLLMVALPLRTVGFVGKVSIYLACLVSHNFDAAQVTRVKKKPAGSTGNRNWKRSIDITSNQTACIGALLQ